MVSSGVGLGGPRVAGQRFLVQLSSNTLGGRGTVTRPILLIAAFSGAVLLSACCGTSQSGNLVRANGRYQDGNYNGAIELSDFILAQGPVTPEIGAQAGLLKGFSLERLGRTSEAIAVYEYIVQAYGDSTTGAQARGRLKALSNR